MKKSSIILIAFLWMIPPKSQSQSWQLELDSVLGLMENESTFDGQVLIAEKGKILFHKAYGNSDSGEEISLKSTFQIHSLSKNMTALAILQLQQNEKLNLDDKLASFFPRLPYPQVTIRQLLNQTSGLPRFLEAALGNADTTVAISNPEIIKLIERLRTQSDEPQTSFKYNNANYILLGSIVEKVSGVPFYEFMEQAIWQPAGMIHTSDLVSGKPLPTPANADNFFQPFGDGSVSSNSLDLFLLDQAMYSEWLLSEESKKNISEQPTLKNGTKSNYGFGWIMAEENGEKILQHVGDGVNMRASFQRFWETEKTLIVLHVNSNVYANEAYWAIRNIWEGKPYELPRKRNIYSINPELYDKYVGKYLSGFGLVHVTQENGKLFLRPDPVPGKKSLCLPPIQLSISRIRI